MTRATLRHRWEKIFDKQDDFDFLYPALTDLINLDVLSEYDVEFSGVLDGASADHSAHGEIDFFDLEKFSGLDELIHMSRGAPGYAAEHVSELTNAAMELGLDKALQTLTAMPIDSTAWTGLPKGFVFTEHTKTHLVSLLEKAADALERSNLSNFEVGQGCAYLRAAKILVDAPEPPQKEIWSILNKGSAIASIASFFLPILQWIKG